MTTKNKRVKIVVHMRTRAHHEKIEQVEDGIYRVWVKALPVGGQANDALIALLAKEFAISKSSIRIVLGKTSREKLIELVL